MVRPISRHDFLYALTHFQPFRATTPLARLRACCILIGARHVVESFRIVARRQDVGHHPGQARLVDAENSSPDATCRYSWMRPPSLSRRSTEMAVPGPYAASDARDLLTAWPCAAPGPACCASATPASAGSSTWTASGCCAAHYNTARSQRVRQLRPPRPTAPLPSPSSAGSGGDRACAGSSTSTRLDWISLSGRTSCVRPAAARRLLLDPSCRADSCVREQRRRVPDRRPSRRPRRRPGGRTAADFHPVRRR